VAVSPASTASTVRARRTESGSLTASLAWSSVCPTTTSREAALRVSRSATAA
jgi:hypothetical protein